MESKAQKLIKFFKNKGGITRFSDILKAGFHPDSLISIEKEGKVEKLARGLYCLTDFVPSSHPDLVSASLQATRGVICLISALSFHEVTNEIPKYIDIAIVRGTHANRIKYPPVKFYQFSINTWKTGVEEHDIEGHKIKVYNLAKTIADCFKFRNKIGIDVAREAMKIAVQEKGEKPTEIIKFAKLCRVTTIIKPILETIL